MNFFEAQDNARRKTWRLAALFATAVISLIVMTNLLVAGVYLWTRGQASATAPSLSALLEAMPIQSWLLISVGVIGIVTLASLFKYLTLRGGGRTIAEAMGGQLLSRSNPDPHQRRLLNVVEEMAIAAGVAVPPVYLIPELSINAFAAGFTPDDAVIGINQGTLEHLSRDELQGVVGHEFSHILNGDTRINLRLIAILHGILFIGMIGYGILRGFGRGSRRSNSNGGGLPVLALGAGLMAIGYAGTFFGNLIKAAVSRQREYLADAAAVQFTRNPDGIAAALKKIGGLSYGSTMTGAAANEASHMFFGQSRRLFFNRLMATHPPLDRRIRAIDPNWNGRYPELETSQPTAPALDPRTAGFAGVSDRLAVEVVPEQVAERVGQVDQQALDSAVALIESTGAPLRDAAHDPWASRALIHAMLLSTDTVVRADQLAHLAANTERAVYEQVGRLAAEIQEVDDAHKLMLLEMSMASLKTLSPGQYQRFMNNAIALIKADAQIELFEWVLHRLLIKELRPHFEPHKPVRARYGSLEQVADAARVLLSALAREQDDTADAVAAFAKGMHTLGISGDLESQDDPNYGRLNAALRKLRKLKPLAKPKLIKACATVVLTNGVSPRQGALLQGIAAALDCPIPPSIYASESTDR